MNKYVSLNKRPFSNKIAPYIKWIIIIILAVILVLIARSYANSTYKKELTKFEPEIQTRWNNFHEQLKGTDLSSYELTILGKKMLESNQPEWAIIVLEKASEKDTKYRDAALFTGYAYLEIAEKLKNKETNAQINNLTMQQFDSETLNQKAIEYLNRAKDIDPIYSQTYELLTIAYQDKGDAQNAELCYNKFKEFSKN